MPSARDRAVKNTPSFKSGYSDGCASATNQDTNYRRDQMRDESAYAADRNYRSGWAAGFSGPVVICTAESGILGVLQDCSAYSTFPCRRMLWAITRRPALVV